MALTGITASAQLPASDPARPVFVVRHFGAVPKIRADAVLLKNEGVRSELKITEDQKAEHSRDLSGSLLKS